MKLVTKALGTNLGLSIVYFLSIVCSYFVLIPMQGINNISLVSDEGVYIAYSHLLAGFNLLGWEQELIVDYGTNYWMSSLFLLLPSSFLNRIGIEGVLSLRITVWLIGYLGFYLFLKNCRWRNRSKAFLTFAYLGLFPMGLVIRYFGLKDTIISTLLISIIVVVQKSIPLLEKNLREIPKKKLSVITIMGCSLIFIESYYVLLISTSFVLVSIIRKKVSYLFIASVLFIVFALFQFGEIAIQQRDSSASTIEKIGIERFIDPKNVTASGQFVPLSKSFIQLDESEELDPIEGSIWMGRIGLLTYFNLSTVPAIVLSIESAFWLILLFYFLFRCLFIWRLDARFQFPLILILISNVAILLYENNFGTYVRHRDQLLLSAILLFSQLSPRKFSSDKTG